MLSIVGICIGIVLFAALAVFVYYLIYTKNINKKIRSGEIDGKRLADIPKAIMTAVIVVLVLFCGVLSHFLRTAYNSAGKVTRNNYAVIDISEPRNYKYISYFGSAELGDASFAEIYSVERNIGYTKEVITDGDFIFTVFRRESEADSFHPDFLCYCEYSGMLGPGMAFYHSSSFSAENGFVSAGTVCESLYACLYIGNLDEKNVFTISISVLDEKAASEFADAMHKAQQEDKGEFPSEESFAVSSGKVSIFF